MLLRNLEVLVAASQARTLLDGMWTARTSEPEFTTEVTARETNVQPEMPPAFVRELVALQDRVPEESRFSEYDDYVHVSSLVNLCPRQYALARQNNVTVRNSPSGAMRIVWEMGLAIEAHVIRQMATAFGVDRIIRGRELADQDYMIMGRPDVLVEVTPGWDAVVEIKSIAAVHFADLEQPLANHMLQAVLYHWLVSRDRTGRRVHDEVILLYAAKDYIRGGIYKEFHINVNDDACQSMLSVALDLALELKNAMTRDGLPARRLCGVQDCSKARSCPVATLCFNIQGEAS